MCDRRCVEITFPCPLRAFRERQCRKYSNRRTLFVEDKQVEADGGTKKAGIGFVLAKLSLPALRARHAGNRHHVTCNRGCSYTCPPTRCNLEIEEVARLFRVLNHNSFPRLQNKKRDMFSFKVTRARTSLLRRWNLFKLSTEYVDWGSWGTSKVSSSIELSWKRKRKNNFLFLYFRKCAIRLSGKSVQDFFFQFHQYDLPFCAMCCTRFDSYSNILVFFHRVFINELFTYFISMH